MIDVFEVSGIKAGRLGVSLRPRGGDWLSDELHGLKQRGWMVLVTTLERSELQELELGELGPACREAGVEWIHFPITDRGLPSVAAMRSVTAAIGVHLSGGDGVAVHCRQGIGRSSLVVAATLVSGGATTQAAWNTVENARGRLVPDTQDQREWLSSFAATVR